MADLLECATQIVAAQVVGAPDIDVCDSLKKIHGALMEIRDWEAGVDTPEGRLTADNSIQRDKVYCLECRTGFKLLCNQHLRKHGLTPRQYKTKHGIPLTTALSARSLTRKRKQYAIDHDMDQGLVAWRVKRGYKERNIDIS